MAFYSILFPSGEEEARARNHPWMTLRADHAREEKYTTYGNKTVLAQKNDAEEAVMRPGLYLDLNLDQIMDAVLCHETDHNLTELFYQFCPDGATVTYRQEVMRALEEPQVRGAFQAFLRSMVKAGRLLDYGATAHHAAQRDKYALDGAVLYCDAVRLLLDETSALPIKSQGLQCFLAAVRAYAGEERFGLLAHQTRQAQMALEQISYALRVNDGVLHVDFEADAFDYAQALRQDFDTKERWGTEADEGLFDILPFRQVELSPLETLIMQALMRRYPQAFGDARLAAEKCGVFPELFIARFTKELRFYLLYLDLMDQLRKNGLAFAYPAIAGDDGISITNAYDLALAIQTKAIVPNDFVLSKEERGAVITGANQGGKTTFARAIGQVAVLTALGLPVPCERAALPLYSAVFSQFTMAEDSTVDNGKLKEELLRLRPILRGAGNGSLVILNELFSSATASDALDMAERALSLMLEAGAQVICVTHINGIAVKHTVSMVAQVQKENGRRLYKVMRAEADGQAYAGEIARRHHLTFHEIKERITHGV